MPQRNADKQAPRTPPGGLEPGIGCDLGGTNLKAVRLGPGGVEAAVTVPTPSQLPATGILDVLAATIESLLPRHRAQLPVGIALPGFLDRERQSIVRLSNLPALDGVALAPLLTSRIPRARVTLDADTNAGALAEACLGSGVGHERVLYVTLGTGLGAALIVNGAPVRVSRHTVGQVAHLPLGEQGRRCYCGARGCAETLLGARGILERAHRAGLVEVTSPLELAEIATTPGRHSARARKVWKETGQTLGRLLQLIGALFAPDVIVVGGGISQGAALFLPAASRALERLLTPRLSPRVTVSASQLGTFAGAIGAALLAERASSA